MIEVLVVDVEVFADRRSVTASVVCNASVKSAMKSGLVNVSWSVNAVCRPRMPSASTESENG